MVGNVNSQTLDQEQTNTMGGAFNANFGPLWQSFVPEIEGDLVQVNLFTGISANAGGTLSIYEGTGVGGTLLHTQDLPAGDPSSEESITLDAPVPLTVGETYTISINGAVYWWAACYGLCYEEGTSSEADFDPYSFAFRTYMGDGCTASESSLTETACQAYTVPSGDETYTESGVYMDTIPNMAGCDSIMTIDVTITNLDITVTESDFILTSGATGVSYQWLDCNDSYSEIPGETDAAFEVVENGSYAVEIDDAGCVDTSECTVITSLGINENEAILFDAYPNPVQEELTLVFLKEMTGWIQVYSVDGKKVKSIKITEETKKTISTENFDKGSYWVVIRTDGYLLKKHIIKN